MPGLSIDERELVKRLRAGSRAAFEALMDRSERRVYNLALRMLDGDPSEAEDATQDIFLEVYRALPGFNGRSRLDTWVHRIAVNVCLQRRRKKRLPTVELDEMRDGPACANGAHSAGLTDPLAEAVRSEMRDHLGAAVQALPEGQRAVVLLHGMQGLSYSEVAEALGCPVGTVKSRLSTAFKRLRAILPGYMAGEVPEPVETGR